MTRHESADRAIVGRFRIRVEVAGGKLAHALVIGDALAALALL